jgi:integrase
VADWHKKIVRTSGPAAADHAAKILRAMYRHAMRRDTTLPPGLPTAAVEFVGGQRSQDALDFADFPAWRAAWDKIESPTRKAFQLLDLLCGARPGELARLKWVDVLPRERVFVIRAAKSRKATHDIRVVMPSAIARALKLARDAAGESEWVFPSRDGGHIVKFDCDGLPAHGMMLRRTWRTVAADVGVDELVAHFLLGHIPPGISAGYVQKMILASGQGMRAAQRAVSKRIVGLLGVKL